MSAVAVTAGASSKEITAEVSGRRAAVRTDLRVRVRRIGGEALTVRRRAAAMSNVRAAVAVPTIAPLNARAVAAVATTVPSSVRAAVDVDVARAMYPSEKIAPRATL